MNYFRCGGGRSTHTATKIDVAKTSLATFESNVSGLYIPEILAYIQATQSGSGDPSPSNPRAINGVSSVDTTVCGKNLFNGTNVINAYFSSNGTITASGATRLVYARCKSNTAYTVSKTAGARFGVAYSSELPEVGLQCSGYTADNTASSITITTDADANYICAYVYHSSYDSGTAQEMLDSVQIEESNTATPYEAYTGQTATTALSTTCYGGYLNLETGVLTRTHGYVDLGSLNWSYANSRFNVSFAQAKLPPNTSTAFDGLCEIYNVSPSLSLADKGICITSGGLLRVYDSDYTDATTFKTAVSGKYLAYELATPTTEQLTPHQIEQLLGQNNVFCSSGDVAVKGWKID